jgi:hypothetical protein
VGFFDPESFLKNTTSAGAPRIESSRRPSVTQNPMKKTFPPLLAALAVAILAGTVSAQPSATTAPAGKYQNFSVAIYVPVGLVRNFADPRRLESEWARISSQLKVDKVYIETERDRVMADDALLENVKKFFTDRGVRVAGGITYSDGSVGGQFRSFCYTDPADRAFIKQATEQVARHFDEIILDDFFFVATKYDSDIAAKGARSWTQFRLDLMDDAGRELVVGAAKAVNPRVKVVIKYPNWYEHFQGLGFDLKQGPKIFDGIYTGTETRDPDNTDQFLQQYESYQIIRYFERIAPGRNGGGWVDTFSLNYADRYVEQLWDTMFAKAREMTLFNWGALLQPVRPGERAAWEKLPTSFNYDRMLAYRQPRPAPADAPPATIARMAGYALEQADAVVGQLGQPIGIASYRPPHATGEDFLHNYLGMIGIPIDLRPTFPEDAPVVLLTEAAKFDPDIVAKIKKQLVAGKSVIVTSGLARALKDRGLDDIVELEHSGRRILAESYSTGFGAGTRTNLANEATGAPPVLFPQVGFLTNDAWSLVSAMSDGVGYPLLLLDRYSKEGIFYVWTIPDNFHHLYRLPPPVTSVIKNAVMRGFPVRLDGPGQVALFAYDNSTFVVESFLPGETDVKAGTLGNATKLRDLVSGEIINATPPAADQQRRRPNEERRASFAVHVQPHSFRAFIVEP